MKTCLSDYSRGSTMSRHQAPTVCFPRPGPVSGGEQWGQSLQEKPPAPRTLTVPSLLDTRAGPERRQVLKEGDAVVMGRSHASTPEAAAAAQNGCPVSRQMRETEPVLWGSWKVQVGER